jgi:hypothetical protein
MSTSDGAQARFWTIQANDGGRSNVGAIRYAAAEFGRREARERTSFSCRHRIASHRAPHGRGPANGLVVGGAVNRTSLRWKKLRV